MSSNEKQKIFELDEQTRHGLFAGRRGWRQSQHWGSGKSLDQVYPETVHQRCWFYNMGNVLAALPKSLQGKAKADLPAIWMADTKDEATRALERFLARYGAKYPKATEKLRRHESRRGAKVTGGADLEGVSLENFSW